MKPVPICRFCSRPAVIVDGLFPYETLYNRCAVHKEVK
jgi:hypothetical protein